MGPAGNPTVLLIHGCFSTPACFDRLVPYLEKAGYPTIGATYPSSNPKEPDLVSAAADIEHVRTEYLLPLIESEHKDLILVVHSFGGVVAGGAASGLSTTDRKAQGLEGGVVGLVYIAANIVHENQTLIESAGGEWPPWLIKDTPHDGVGIVDPLMDTIYNDCDPSLEPELRKAMVPQGYRCLDTKATAPCWAEKAYTGRLAYVRTALDGVNPAWAQDMWMQGTGVDWHVARMETSHAPYISRPQDLSEIIVSFAHKFETLGDYADSHSI